MVLAEANGDGLAKRVRAAVEVLEAMVFDKTLLASLPQEERTRLFQAAGQVYCPDPIQRRRLLKTKRRLDRAARTQRDENIRLNTGIRALRRKPVFNTPNVFPPTEKSKPNGASDPAKREILEDQHCYICKRGYSTIHHFYDQLCPACAELNFQKRTELADLRGRVALLTGGRVKIGYQAGLKLLRAGAELIVTTRFPRDSATRYANEPDFAEWGHRLEIFGLDLRHTPSVEAFCQHMFKTRNRLDFIINNACQTVRRPPDFYEHMMARETGPLQELSPEANRLLGAYEGLRGYHLLPEGEHAVSKVQASGAVGLTHSAALSQVRLLPEELLAQRHLFPEGKLDQDLQQVDLRERNSWRLTLAEVGSVELLEVHLINAVAPFVLNARLNPLMLRTPERDKHIVNVSAVEGQFYRKFKTTPPPAYKHGQGGAEHDDAHFRSGLPGGWYPHEQRRHRLGDG